MAALASVVGVTLTVWNVLNTAKAPVPVVQPVTPAPVVESLSKPAPLVDPVTPESVEDRQEPAPVRGTILAPPSNSEPVAPTPPVMPPPPVDTPQYEP